MVSSRFLNNNLPPPRQLLHDKTLLKKKNYSGEMLIEQITVLNLNWGLGLLIVYVLRQLVIDVTKISEENLLVGYCLPLKFAEDNVTCFPLPGPNHLQNLTSKCKILNVFWT